MPIRGRYLAYGAHQPKGFSLIEVMIVVAIIGILATLAYPSLEGYLQRAKQSEVKTNLAAIHTAEKLYHACLLYTSPSPRDLSTSRMPSSA